MRPVGLSFHSSHPPTTDDEAAQPESSSRAAPTKRLERSLAKRYQYDDVAQPHPAESNASPDSSKLKPLPAGHYEHLGDIVARMKIDQALGEKVSGDGGRSAAHTASSSAEASSSTSRTVFTRHRDAHGFADSLQELAQWSEKKATASLAPQHMFGMSGIAPNLVEEMLKRELAMLAKDMVRAGIPLEAVLTHQGKKSLGINLNYLEIKSFLTSKGVWGDNSGGHMANELVKKADNYFAHFHAQGNRPLAPLTAPRGKDSISVMRELLHDSPGLVIGEAHHTVSSKRELIKNMAGLKAAGVSTLFMEHLCADSHGKALAEYLSAPKNSAMPTRLSAYLDMQDRGQSGLSGPSPKYNFKQIIRAAKEAGIAVIPIDTAETYSASKSPDNSRIKLMNYYAAEKIRLSEPPDKWLVFVGSAHASTYNGVPGLAELKGVRSMIIDDHGRKSRPYIDINVKGYADGQLNPDIVLSYKKPGG
ncbi:membrane-targeted effector domain-containing toxin [uncultured Klebsiella sp.]|uniref:membrane-targeted effector domain-containing toxin n=1 Tax=uncultured Klebsiella sp. TaxID=284011 RepID=UPI0028046AC0|nr:membrane-targeted effector domain-containing toxin [uncultured Klebsiella sp.]